MIRSSKALRCSTPHLTKALQCSTVVLQVDWIALGRGNMTRCRAATSISVGVF